MIEIRTRQTVGGLTNAIRECHQQKLDAAIDEAAKQFWPMIGTANQVAYMAIDDAVEAMREAGMLRQQEKVKANKALEEYARYEKAAYEHYRSIGDDRYYLWQDLKGRAAEKLQPDVMKLYFSVKNVLDRDRVKNSAVLAHIQTALALVTLSTLMFDTLMEQYKKKAGVRIRANFEAGRLTAVERNWTAVAEMTGKKVMKTVNLRDDEQCQLGIRVLLARYESADFLNEAAQQAIRHNPGVMKYCSDEDRKTLLNDDKIWEENG